MKTKAEYGYRFGSAGFTLIEVLIAVAIFAIIASITSGVLHHLSMQYEHFNLHTNKLRQHLFATVILKSDLRTMVNQPVYQSDGKLLPAFDVSREQIAFTALSKSQQPALIRVHYLFRNHALLREVDAIEANTIMRKLESAILLSDINTVHWQFLSYGQGFTDNWPPGNLGGKTFLSRQPLPKAIRLVLSLGPKNSTIDYLISVPATDLMDIVG